MDPVLSHLKDIDLVYRLSRQLRNVSCSRIETFVNSDNFFCSDSFLLARNEFVQEVSKIHRILLRILFWHRDSTGNCEEVLLQYYRILLGTSNFWAYVDTVLRWLIVERCNCDGGQGIFQSKDSDAIFYSSIHCFLNSVGIAYCRMRTGDRLWRDTVVKFERENCSNSLAKFFPQSASIASTLNFRYGNIV